MTKDDLKSKAMKLSWSDLRDLWDAIDENDKDGFREWEGRGNAFEYLIIRAFELSSKAVQLPPHEVEVEYPYLVPYPYGGADSSESTLEEIDGFVRVGYLSSLIQSKNYDKNINVEPISKLKNQLQRRPSTTVGSVFSKKDFTDPAKILVGYCAPQAILLWNGDEIRECLDRENMIELLLEKYHHLQRFGQQDFRQGTKDEGTPL